MRQFVAIALTVCALVSSPALASAKPVVALKLSGAYVMNDAAGKEKLVSITSSEAKSGEHIRWDIVATNSGDQAARTLVPMGKISPSTSYVANSATGTATKIEFSIDGGKTWSTSPTVVVKTPDGPKTVKADPSLYTMIRWFTSAPLKPGASAHYTYEVTVK